MKVIDILRQKHTVIMSMDGLTEHQGLYDYTQKDLSLNDIIFHLGKKFEKTIDYLREQEYHGDRYKYIKDNCLPVWFAGGTFPFAETDDAAIKSYSNILCIDIDNQNIDRKSIYDLPYVIGVLKSVGGVGYYVLILIEDGKYTKEYYSYLAKLFKQKFNIEVDKQCTNIGRKRVLSYEENIWEWIKPIDYDVTAWKLKDVKKDEKISKIVEPIPDCSKFTSNNNLDFTRKAIWKLLENGLSIDDFNTINKYSVWYNIACEFAHFDDGESMFYTFSKNSSNYNDTYAAIKKKWNNADKSKTNINDVCKKWCGMCKNKFGKEWWRQQSLRF